MPWIDKSLCTSCGVCSEECIVGAITLEEDGAVIDEEHCIRCGRCHDVCPQEAVRHDGERIPQEIEANIDWVQSLLRHHQGAEAKRGLLDRMQRYFEKEKKVAMQTIERVRELAAGL